MSETTADRVEIHDELVDFGHEEVLFTARSNEGAVLMRPLRPRAQR